MRDITNSRSPPRTLGCRVRIVLTRARRRARQRYRRTTGTVPLSLMASKTCMASCALDSTTDESPTSSKPARTMRRRAGHACGPRAPYGAGAASISYQLMPPIGMPSSKHSVPCRALVRPRQLTSDAPQLLLERQRTATEMDVEHSHSRLFAWPATAESVLARPRDFVHLPPGRNISVTAKQQIFHRRRLDFLSTISR